MSLDDPFQHNRYATPRLHTHRDAVLDGHGEQPRLLRHDTHAAAQTLHVHARQLLAVNGDGATLRACNNNNNKQTQ